MQSKKRYTEQAIKKQEPLVPASLRRAKPRIGHPAEVHAHAGYGIDNPRASDLAPTQIRKNQTYFVNWVWDVSKALQLGLEVDYRKTDYTQFAPNAFLNSDAVVIATRFLWRF